MRAIDERTTEMLLDGRYRLGPCLGRGGSGVVYQAEDTLLGRAVAIKLLGHADDAPSDLTRARSETTVLASLSHPSLVTLFDARLDPEHARYLAMELVDGPTLATRIKDGSMTPEEVASLAGDLAEALQVVHDAGIIHRDVKPSNILLAPNVRREAGWTAKLTDFGIAFSLGDPRVTSPGIVIGTAAYMAPEQVSGAVLTPGVDIYSLGLVLIEALTGEPAFPAAPNVATALRRLTNSPILPESLDPRWAALLTRMTSSEPAERPSAEEVADAVTFLRVDASSARSDTAALPATLTPLRSGEADTGPTEELAPSAPAGAAEAAARRRKRSSRVGILSAMAAITAAAIAVAGFWMLSPATDSSPRVVSPVSARLTFEPPAAEAPTDSTPADETSEPEATDSLPTTDTQTTDSSPDGTTGPPDSVNENSGNGAPNPNKGPGNNSGKKDEAPGKKK
jgi:serine/threonine protein kinase